MQLSETYFNFYKWFLRYKQVPVIMVSTQSELEAPPPPPPPPLHNLMLRLSTFCMYGRYSFVVITFSNALHNTYYILHDNALSQNTGSTHDCNTYIMSQQTYSFNTLVTTNTLGRPYNFPSGRTIKKDQLNSLDSIMSHSFQKQGFTLLRILNDFLDSTCPLHHISLTILSLILTLILKQYFKFLEKHFYLIVLQPPPQKKKIKLEQQCCCRSTLVLASIPVFT